MAHIYKIFRLDEWFAFAKSGRFAGSADDKRDGFIHFSSPGQVSGTLAKHYHGEEIIVLAACDDTQFGGALKYEASRGGALFPHLYAELLCANILSARRLVRGAGGFAVPEPEAAP